MKISAILDMIDLGAIALPEFQRGYVWNREQVRGLMHSLYHKHPVGSLLVWATTAQMAATRGDGKVAPGVVSLLLDGQQRITSLYGIVRGRAPKFFDGNAETFTGMFFHLDDEAFEFYAPVKMKDNPYWIDVTRLMQNGSGPFVSSLFAMPGFDTSKLTTYITRLTRIEQVKEIDLHIEEVTGEDKTVDVVVDIFNRVNSGGTKLSKGDLALAKVCAGWPEARNEMKVLLEKWRKAGYWFELDWLMRCTTTILTGEALFTSLKDVDTPTFQQGLKQAEKAVDILLNTIAGRLGLDHDRVLGSRYSFPLLARYLASRNWRLGDYRERDKLLYWYVHTFLWGRYTGSTESILNQDLGLIEDPNGALDRLIAQLRRIRGDLRISAVDFAGWSRNARFYPLLYMLTRVWHARDWETGLELSSHLLGRFSRLELHHIFPKSLLYKNGYQMSEVNALANFTFLTNQANLIVTDHDPAQYLAEIARRHPGALESHWIPMDRKLWKVENYRAFMAARRELLANAANDFLASLLAGSMPEAEPVPSVLERVEAAVPGGVATAEEERLILEANEWVAQRGLPEGRFAYELVDPSTQELLAVLDLAWPDGLQVGLSQPVALLIDESRETIEAVNRVGYRYFTSLDDFQQYVEREVLAMDLAGV